MAVKTRDHYRIFNFLTIEQNFKSCYSVRESCWKPNPSVNLKEVDESTLSSIISSTSSTPTTSKKDFSVSSSTSTKAKINFKIEWSDLNNQLSPINQKKLSFHKEESKSDMDCNHILCHNHRHNLNNDHHYHQVLNDDRNNESKTLSSNEFMEESKLSNTISPSTLEQDERLTSDDDNSDLIMLNLHGKGLISEERERYYPLTRNRILKDMQLGFFEPGAILANRNRDVGDRNESRHLLYELINSTHNYKINLKINTDDKISEESILKEASVLQKLDHTNILKCYGCISSQGIDRYGSLLEHLEPMVLPEPELSHLGFTRFNPNHANHSIHTKVNNMILLSNVLEYLHYDADPNYHLIHGSIMPSFIGFTTSGVIKLMGFHRMKKKLKEAKQDELLTSPKQCIHTKENLYSYDADENPNINMIYCRYMAPEVVKSASTYENIYSKRWGIKSDVYSWGISMAEYLLVECVFKDLSVSEFQKNVVNGNTRPPIHKLKRALIGGVDKHVLRALRLSWKGNIVERGDIRTVRFQLLDSTISDVEHTGIISNAILYDAERHWHEIGNAYP